MYGLPVDTDLSFLAGATLLQVCVGENEVILNLNSSSSVMIASSVCFLQPDGTLSTLDNAPRLGQAVLPLLGQHVTSVSVVAPGTLRLMWSSGQVTEILDSWREYESYTITHGDRVLVV